MISVEVNGNIDIHNVAILERPAKLKMRIIVRMNSHEANSLVWDPVAQDIVDARATGFGKARIE